MDALKGCIAWMHLNGCIEWMHCMDALRGCDWDGLERGGVEEKGGGVGRDARRGGLFKTRTHIMLDGGKKKGACGSTIALERNKRTSL